MSKNFVVKSIINKQEREVLYKILYIGLSAYNRFITENRELIKSNAFGEIRTRLLSFMIKRQFDEDMIPIGFPFKVDFSKVNAFNNVALFLNKDKIKIQVNKTSGARKLYNSTKPSKYMLREAEVNSKYTNRIEFVFDENNDGHIEDNKNIFMVLGYGIKNKEIDHLEFLIPESDMKECIDAFDAIDEYKKFIDDDMNEEEVEGTIVAVKKEALQFVSNFGR